jgi:hypothetical protein
MIKNILVDANPFSWHCGGTIAQYNLSSLLDDNLGVNVRMLVPRRVDNPIFTKFYDGGFNPNETLVIYGETITNNKLCGIYVMRWILAPIGKNCPSSIYGGWGEKDLVYYFNNENRFEQLQQGVVKFLNPMYINPIFKKNNFNVRTLSVYTERKIKYHSNPVIPIHPLGSQLLPFDGFTHEDLVILFNQADIFYCYDPLTFLTIIAAMCGCVSVVYKVEGKTKYDWLMTLALSDYMKSRGIDNIYGIAYGVEDIEYARSTLHLVEEQWNDIKQYYKKNVAMFVEDLKNYDELKNNVQNNYVTPLLK